MTNSENLTADPAAEMQKLMELLTPCLSGDSPPVVRLIKKDAKLIVSYIRTLEARNEVLEKEKKVMRGFVSSSIMLTKEALLERRNTILNSLS